MTWTRSAITLVIFLLLAGAGLFYQDRANKHDLEMKKTPPAAALQTPAVAPPIDGDVLAMAKEAQEEAIKDKKRSFSFEGGGAKFDLGAGCNTCTQAPAVASVTPAPVVTSASAKVKPVVIYRDRLAPRNSSVSYRRSAQSEPVRRVEPRVFHAPREARNLTPRVSPKPYPDCRWVNHGLTKKTDRGGNKEWRQFYTGWVCQNPHPGAEPVCPHLNGYPLGGHRTPLERVF